MDRDWTVLLSVKNPDDNSKNLQVKFLKKHINVSSTKPALPRKGDKPDIAQAVEGTGTWLLVKDMPRIGFPYDGDLQFEVTSNGDRKYVLPMVKGVRSLNWHTEKHITKARDGALLRLENAEDDKTESPPSTPKKISLGLPKPSPSSKFIAPLPLQKKNGDSTPAKQLVAATKTPKSDKKSASPSSSSSSQSKSPSFSLSRSASFTSLPTSVEEPPPLKRTSSLIEGKLKSPSSSGSRTPTKGSQDIRSLSPIRPYPQSTPPPPSLSQSLTPQRALTPPALKRTLSKTSPSPKPTKKALTIAKISNASSQSSTSSSSATDSPVMYIESDSQIKEEEEALENEEEVEEIVVPERFYDDSDEETPKKAPKKSSSKQPKENGENSQVKKENGKMGGGEGENKPKKKRKQPQEKDVIDLEEVLRRKDEESSQEGANGKKIKVKEEEKEVKAKIKGEAASKIKKATEASKEKRKQPEVTYFDEDNDFEDSQPQKKKVKEDKEKKRKEMKKEKERETAKKKKEEEAKKEGQDEYVDIMDQDDTKLDEVPVEVKEGERLKYSDTLQYVNEDNGNESDTSEYEYSGMDIIFDAEGEQPSSQTPTKATVGENGTTTANGAPPTGEDVDDGHTKDEALLYSVYRPRVDADVYYPHPANVVEAHTLASVILPDCAYKPSLPKACTMQGGLSSLQLETVAMVGMRHTHMLQDKVTRGGYFIGDGTGVGKGRQIAAIFADNYLKGRKKAIWFSVNTTLYKDARRDLDDIGCSNDDNENYIPLLQMPNKATEPIPSRGVLFATYSTLVSKGTKGGQSRFEQIMKWCGKDFEGVVVFDEGHAAKNLNPGKSGSSLTGQKVFQLQEDLPKARVVYVSATGATEPHHMGYMTRLGLWGEGTQFADFKTFSKDITDAGVGAMEMVAMEMKGRGLYCSRYLSFEGTTFEILKHNLNGVEIVMYDQAVKVWDSILKIGLEMKQHRSTIWAAHQRFFLQMILSTKVADCASIVKTELALGCAVVIGLFSTGEALAGEEREEESEELFSAPQQTLLNVVEKITSDPEGKLVPEMAGIRKSFGEEIEALHLPENPLDKLIDQLGGVEEVAEMTGRRKRFVRAKGGFKLENRDSKAENLAERFQGGEKNIAIISDAASMGISLQADMSCENTKQRVHIILQLPWAADKAVQQLGRTHRSHQATAPNYKLIITDLGGEWRLASTIAARLASLGALTNADRRAAAASKSLSKFLLQPKYVLDALRAVDVEMKENAEAADLYKKFVFMECFSLGNNNGKTKKFLNRLLGFSIESQKKVFDLFMNQYERQVLQAQKEGRFDDGVYDLQGDLVSGPEVLYVNPVDKSQVTEKYVIAIDRGIKWKKAVQFLRDADKTKQGVTKIESNSNLRNGFYKNTISGQVILAVQRLDSKHYFHICKPHLGHQRGYMTRADLRNDYKLIKVQIAKKLWTHKYDNADGEGKGQRMIHQNIIIGSILPIFSILIQTIDKDDKIQIVRARCGAKRLVGVHLHEDYMKELINNLHVLENNKIVEKRKQDLLAILAHNGVNLDPQENLDIFKQRLPILQSFLDAGNLHLGKQKKRKGIVEQYHEAGGNKKKAVGTSILSNQKLEDVASAVIGFIRRRDLRKKELNVELEKTGIPAAELRQYNSILCNSFVATDNVATTARSIAETLKFQYDSHAPCLAFLRKVLEFASKPVHYNQVVDMYKAAFPGKSGAFDISNTMQLPKSITNVDYVNHEFLVWRKR